MNRTYLVLIPALCYQVAACAQPSPQSRLAIAVSRDCPNSTSADYYFPRGSFRSLGANDDGEAVRGLYANYLRAFDAPSLSCGEVPSEAIRLMWLPDYRPAVVVSITKAKSGDGWILDGAEFQHPNTNHPFAIVRRLHSEVPTSRAKQVTEGLNDFGFWTQLPMIEPANGPGGDKWVLEGRVDGSFHVVTRVPPIDDRLRQLGVLFVDLAGIETDIGTRR